MKTSKLKTLTTTLTLIASMSFASIILADDIEVTLPVISKPAVLEEGTQRGLSEEQVAELLPWAKDSKVFLNDLLNSLQGLTSQDKVDQLVQGIKSVVGDSAPKNSELLMRYVLNRGLIINEMLTREMDADATGTVDAKIRVLIASVDMAISCYDNDLAMMSKKSSAPLAQFGNNYFNFLTELNKSVFDASAQYVIYRTALEWFQWDLYRDLNNRSFATQIVKINNSLKLYPNKRLSDAQSIAFIRQMKAVAVQVDVQTVITKMKQDEQAAIQRKLDEENQIIKKQEAENAVILKKKQVEEAAIAKKLKEEEAKNNAKAKEDELLKKFGAFIETTQVFENPRVNGINFSGHSIPDGVCLVLGYQKSLANKYSTVRVKDTFVTVDADGNFTGAVQSVGGSYERTTFYTSITCANKLVSKKNVQVDKVSSFSFLDGINISSKSNVNGVCKLSGYEKGLDGSLIKGAEFKEAMALVEENGKIESIDEYYKSSILKEVICVNKKSEPKVLPLVKVDYPKVDESLFSKNSNAQGICKKIGYKKALNGVYLENISTASTVLVADVTGEVVNTEFVSVNKPYVKSVVCFK